MPLTIASIFEVGDLTVLRISNGDAVVFTKKELNRMIEQRKGYEHVFGVPVEVAWIGDDKGIRFIH